MYMGFLGGFLTIIPEFTDQDKKEAYYVIDEIRFNSDLTTNDMVEITIVFNIYPSVEDRINRSSLIGSNEFNKRIPRNAFTGDILEEYYIHCKPLIIEGLKQNLRFKLGLDILDEIPESSLLENAEYYTLTDHL